MSAASAFLRVECNFGAVGGLLLTLIANLTR
jgi:hypothetical protein